MNKMIKMVVVAAGVGAMLGFAGCGESADSPEAVVKAAVAAQIREELKIEPDLRVSGSDIKGDKGVVSLDFYLNGKNVETKKHNVIKVNGKWTLEK